MKLQVSVPSALVLQAEGVRSVTAQTASGSLGLLPNRLDCVAILMAGILAYENADGARQYVAVDEGLLVKAGEEVRVAVHHALAGNDLAVLQDEVARMVAGFDAEERDARLLLARMESGFIRQFDRLRHG